MISKNILYLYLKNFLTHWIIFSSILLSFETLLGYIKELKLMSSSYTHTDLVCYLAKGLPFSFIELAPLSIFIALVFTNWNWTQQRLWLAYSVIGSTRTQLSITILVQIVLLLSITVPLYWFYGPHLRYEASYQRMTLQGTHPQIQIGQHYLQNQTLFYPMSDNQMFIFDFSNGYNAVQPWSMSDDYTVTTPSHKLNLTQEIDALLGYNKLDIQQRYEHYKQAALDPVRQEELKTSLIDALVYPFLIMISIVLAWIAAPIQAIKRQANLSSFQLVFASMILYGGQKMLGLATRFVAVKTVVWTYIGLLLVTVLMGRLARRSN